MNNVSDDTANITPSNPSTENSRRVMRSEVFCTNNRAASSTAASA